MPIQLDTLHRCQHLLPQIAQGLWQEFEVAYISYFNFRSWEDVAHYLDSMHVTAPEPLPCIVVHNGQGTLVGFCNLVTDDLGDPWNETITHPLWLANLYVAPDFRSQGVGDIMVTYMRKNYVPFMETPVHLWTYTISMRDWYRRRHGFVHVQTIQHYAQHPEIYIMRCGVPPPLDGRIAR